MGLAWASPRLVGASSRTETLARSSQPGLRLASCDDKKFRVRGRNLGICREKQVHYSLV